MIVAIFAIPYQIWLLKWQRKQERQDRFIESLLDQFGEIETELLRINADLLKRAMQETKPDQMVEDFAEISLLITPFEHKFNKLFTLLYTFESAIPSSLIEIARDVAMAYLRLGNAYRERIKNNNYLKGNVETANELTQEMLSTLAETDRLISNFRDSVRELPSHKK
jgi:hypothetical protein